MSSNVSAAIEITDSRATADYWISRNQNGNNILLMPKQITKLNAYILERDNFSADLENYPSVVSAEKVNELIKTAESKHYKDEHAVNSDVEVRYAVTVQRGNIRVLPSDWDGDNYDNLQGTAIDPAEAVVVLADSPDGKFVFVQSRNYIGWLNKSNIAFTDRKIWLKYTNAKDFVVVVANKMKVMVEEQEILFQMGAKIPLDEEQSELFVMTVPSSENGKLIEHRLLISKEDEEIHKGYLPCTENNFIRQAFKFLGDEYGWGGLNDSVDCSAFVEDIYRTMGIDIPRDANRQESCMPIWAVFNNVTNADRWDIASRAPVGSLLFKPGHVMMKIGNDDEGHPLVIHSASSYYENGEKIYVRKVLVSELHYKNSAGVETINGLTGIGFYGNPKSKGEIFND